MINRPTLNERLNILSELSLLYIYGLTNKAVNKISFS